MSLCAYTMKVALYRLSDMPHLVPFAKKISFLFLLIILFSCRHEPLFKPDLGGGGATTTTVCSPDTAYFQQQVLPIFISNCAMSGCHNETSREHGIILTNYNSIITTGKIRAFSPSSGDVYDKINTSDSRDRMPPPPYPALSADQKNAIYKWIMQGAKNNSCESASCDTANVTYNVSIRPVVQNYCAGGCHAGSSPTGIYNFSTYDGLKAKVNDGKLLGAIKHQPGYQPMPQGSKLSDCDIRKFEKWIAAGALNN